METCLSGIIYYKTLRLCDAFVKLGKEINREVILTNTHIYRNVIYEKAATANHWRKDTLLNKSFCGHWLEI